MKSRESQSGNSNVFDQIKNHQVDAPMDIMNSSITQANSQLFKRKLFRWLGYGAAIVLIIGVICFQWQKESSTVTTAKKDTVKSIKSEQTEVTKSPVKIEEHSVPQTSSQPEKLELKQENSVESTAIRPKSIVEKLNSPETTLEKVSESAPNQAEQAINPVVPVEKDAVQPAETKQKVDRTGQKKLKLKIPKR